MNRRSPPKYPKGIQWLLPWVFRQKQAESVGVTFKKMYKKFNSSKSLMFSQNFKLQYISVSLVTLSVTSGQTKEHNLRPKVGKLMFSVEISKEIVVHFRNKFPQNGEKIRDPTLDPTTSLIFVSNFSWSILKVKRAQERCHYSFKKLK